MIRWFTTYRFRADHLERRHLAVSELLLFGAVNFGEGQVDSNIEGRILRLCLRFRVER